MANLPADTLSAIRQALATSHRVAIFAHKNPDGDSLGATIALSLVLDSLQIANDLICIDTPGESFSFLPKVNDFFIDFDPSQYDLAIVPDVGDLKLISFDQRYPEFFARTKLIRIDHHPHGNVPTKLNWEDSTYAATCEMLVDLFDYFQIKIMPDVATALLTGIYTDTGSLQHSNTTAHVLKTAARLLRAGGSYRQIAKNIFQRTPISTMHLWGRVLSRIDKNADGVVVSAVTQKDYTDCGATREELAGAVDYLNSVEGKYSMLLTEEKGSVKASLRTKSDEVDVAEIARKYGGGGHVKAAGFAVPGHLKPEVRWRVVQEESVHSK